jgi:ribosomal protein S18 acetylase RimI-like enzyme
MTLISVRDPFLPTVHDLIGARLRPLTEEEAARLGTRCAAIDPYRRFGQSAEALTGYLTRPDHSLFRFGVEIDADLIGIVAVRSPWLRGPFLEMLAVLPEAQGKGIGRQAVDWVATEASRIAANLWTTVSDFNGSARGFYRRLGFSEMSELPGLIADGTTEILLRRRLRQ